MSRLNFYIRTLVQTAVYWGNPTPDGYGGFTYDDPVEIPCRWEGKEQVIRAWDGKGDVGEYIGVVFVNQDLINDGCLRLGTLDDLDSEDFEKPLSNDLTYRIKQFERISMLHSTTTFIRKAFLTQWQYR